MVRTSPSNAEDEDLIPGWGAKITHASRPKNQNIETLLKQIQRRLQKMIHIKKKKKNNLNKIKV